MDFDTALKLKPNHADAYHNRGGAYFNKGDFDRAIVDFDTALKLKPDFADTYYNRGVAYSEKSLYNRAIEDYTSAIALKPDLAESYSGRGVAQLHRREWESAKSDLTAAKNMGVNIIAKFCYIYGSVANFERITSIQLPADIAAMLTPPTA